MELVVLLGWQRVGKTCIERKQGMLSPMREREREERERQREREIN